MKTFFKALLFAALMSAGLWANAQMANPYPMVNSSNCDVNITYWWLNGGSSCTQSAGTTITIGWGTTTNVTPPGTAIGIEVVVNWVNSPSCPATQIFSPVRFFQPPPSCGAMVPTSAVTHGCSQCNGSLIQLGNLSTVFQ